MSNENSKIPQETILKGGETPEDDPKIDERIELLQIQVNYLSNILSLLSQKLIKNTSLVPNEQKVLIELFISSLNHSILDINSLNCILKKL
jgi:hypothetical protein